MDAEQRQNVEAAEIARRQLTSDLVATARKAEQFVSASIESPRLSSLAFPRVAAAIGTEDVLQGVYLTVWKRAGS